jgi:arsenate reductase-like glutaredoxin family protein
VDYAKKPLDEATVRSIVKKAGGVAAVLNTRRWGKDNPQPSVDDFIKAVAKEPNMLKRPILVAGNKIVVGFDEAAYRKL